MPRFTYTPLDKRTRQIRLICFDVGAEVGQDGICLSIETYDLSTLPKYYALSYVWGIDAPRHPLIISGKVLMARDNLWLALLQLRIRQFDHNVLHFWIDAICINQDDISERGHQVNLMGDIYSNAHFVVSWLGSGTIDTRIAIKAISMYNTTPDESAKSGILAQKDHQIVSLLKLPYFERMWIVQEFILAKEVIMICGPDSFWWDSEMSTIVKKMSMELFDQGDGLSGTVWLANERANWKQPKYDMDLDRLLVYFRKHKCLDLRDRVYALMGLLDSTQSRSWTADYTVSREQLWCRVINSIPEDSRVLFSYTALKLWEALELPLEDGSLELFRFVFWVIHFDELWNAQNQMPKNIKRHHEENLENRLDATTMFDRIIPHFDRFPPLLEPAIWQTFTKKLRKIMVSEVEQNAQSTLSPVPPRHVNRRYENDLLRPQWDQE
ncbi:heterokaryon incompatibility protein-domain-containing protein [Aspergillus cavernicola]|uniref:Heterokaryon incompatibility protein-domain-containing protein n=1 Tax=Aspergillus cavernicola TaxID=176166 RepID=A0ABR4I2H6_9EURO